MVELTKEEKAALRKIHRLKRKTTREENTLLRKEKKCKYYTELVRSISDLPQWVYSEMTGRVTKTLLSQSDQYGLPLKGGHLNLPKILTAFHDMIADNKHLLSARQKSNEDDPLLTGAVTPGLERYREARADREEIEVKRLRGEVIPRADIRTGHARMATILRGAGEVLQRRFGVEARDVLADALQDFLREAEQTFGKEEEE